MSETQDKQNIKHLFSLNPFVVNFALGATVSAVTIVATGVGGLVAGKAGSLLGMACGFLGSVWGLNGVETVRRNFRILPFVLGFSLGTTVLFNLGEHVRKGSGAPIKTNREAVAPDPRRPLARLYVQKVAPAA